MSRPKGSKNKKTLEKFLDKPKIEVRQDKQKRHRRTKAELLASGYYSDKSNKINVENADKPKRIRRTKEQLLADGYYDKDKPKESKSVDNSELFKSYSLTVDEVSERQIQKAKNRDLDNWESDFRNDYETGQRIYYVEINPLCGTKEVLELYVGTVYAKTMVAWIEKGEAHIIGIDDADKIFREEKEAKKYYTKVRV